MKPAPDFLIGPAGLAHEAVWEICREAPHKAILLDGPPGVGKTRALDDIALKLTGCDFAIEHVNGQSLGIETVRGWRERGPSGNLFSTRTVKRIDEIDLASGSAVAEMLSLLDYMPRNFFILATTNDYAKLRSQSQGRLETRFVRFHVDAPTVQQTARMLMRRHKLPLEVATTIARGAVPEGLLESEGCNVRAALMDAEGYLAALATQQRRASA